MKKHVILATVILFILFQTSQKSIFAMDTMSEDPSPSLSPVITMENKEIQYDLPYPGLLPDNPLYFLKAIRDKITEFLITEPAKKADFEMQQADKRMSMGLYLSNEHPQKDELISATTSKSLNYFQQAIVAPQQAKHQGEDRQSFVQHMDIASQKYRQVILQLETKASDSLKNSLITDQTRLESIRKSVVGMEKK